MKIRLFFLIFFLISSFPAIAQYNGQWQWAEQATTATSNHSSGVQIDASGSILTGGLLGGPGTIFYDTIKYNTSTVYNGYTVKYTPNGQVTWGKQVGDSASMMRTESFTTDKQGNLYFGGWFYDTIKVGSLTMIAGVPRELFLIKLDASGVVQWGKQFAADTRSPGGPSQPGGEYGDITTDTAGNSYIAGWFNDTLQIDHITVAPDTGWCMFVAKFNPQGQVQWVAKNSYGWTGVKSLATDNQGNVFVGGWVQANSFGGGRVHFGAIQLKTGQFICKINPQGQFDWVYNIGKNGYPYNNGVSVNAVTADGAGNSYITGKFEDTLHIQNTVLTKGGGDSDIYVAKFRPDGSVAWAVNDGGSGRGWGSAITTAGNNVYAGGHFSGTTFIGSHALSTPHFQQNSLLVAMLDTAQGQVLGTAQTGHSAAIGHEITAIAADTARNCYFTGYLAGNLTFGNRLLNQGSYLAKLTFSRITGVPEAKEQAKLSIYPNPASDQFTIVLQEALNQPATLQLYDLQGRLILNRKVAAGAASLNVVLPAIAKGCYLVKLQTDKQVWHQKVVIE